MDGFTAQQYDSTLATIETVGLKFKIVGNLFELKRSDDQLLGRFQNLEALYNYVCGYQACKTSRTV